MMLSKAEIENILKNYHWMLNSIKIMRENMDELIGSQTAMYGINASLPKPQGQNSDPVYNDVVRRSKYWERIAKYEEKVKIIQERLHLITDDREIEVLNWILEGKGYSWIAKHMGLSEKHIRRIKDSICEKMAQTPKTPNTPKTPKIGV